MVSTPDSQIKGLSFPYPSVTNGAVLCDMYFHGIDSEMFMSYLVKHIEQLQTIMHPGQHISLAIVLDLHINMSKVKVILEKYLGPSVRVSDQNIEEALIFESPFGISLHMSKL